MWHVADTLNCVILVVVYVLRLLVLMLTVREDFTWAPKPDQYSDFYSVGNAVHQIQNWLALGALFTYGSYVEDGEFGLLTFDDDAHVRVQFYGDASLATYVALDGADDGGWHHYCVAYDGATWALYFDGSLARDGAAALDTGADQRLRLGERAKDERQERKHPARDDSVFTCAGHRRECFSCACSNDGRLLASGSEDGTARVWDATTGALVRVLEGHGKRTGFQQRGGFGALVSAVAFSPDGASLATGCRDNLVRVFDLGTGKIQLQLKGHGAYVSSVEFNVDGGRLVSGSYDETAVVWNAGTGKKRMALLDKKSGHRKTNDIVHYVHHASYDRRGDRVVCASRDGLARIWDGHWDGGGGSTGRLLLTLKGHEAAVLCAKFFVDGRRVVTASQDKSARTWDAKTGDQLAVLLGHTHHITAVACLADGRLVTGAKDYTIRVWEDKWKVHTYDHRVLEGHADRVMAVALAQNDGLLVSASFDRTLKCWDPDPADELFVDRRYAAASAAEAEGLLSAQGSVSLAVSQQGSALEAVAEDGEESWLD